MSTIFRVEKNSNYTVMSNYHIQDQSISWKAKGLLSTILSLPPNWDYTLAGLATIAKDGLDSTRAGIKELEDNGYVNRRRTRDEFGRMSKNEYTVFERPEDNAEFLSKQNKKAENANTSEKQSTSKKRKTSKKTENPNTPKKQINEEVDGNGYNSTSLPSLENPTMDTPNMDFPLLENPMLDNPTLENPMQLNTKELNTKEKNTEYINQSNQSFRKQEYISSEKKIDEDVERITLSPSQYKNWICSNIDYEALIAQHENEKAQIDEIVDNMIEMLCCTASEIQISGVKQPIELVKSRIMKIDSECIDYILLCLERNTKKVRNMKAYLRTVIFNAPSTAANYIASEVNNTLYG